MVAIWIRLKVGPRLWSKNQVVSKDLNLFLERCGSSGVLAAAAAARDVVVVVLV